MQTTLIAEIGNNHFGSLERFKRMIEVAYNCGATLIKSQAFIDTDIKGSMGRDFYQTCSFSVGQYLDLIEFAADKGIMLFYSLFGDGLSLIDLMQRYKKLTAFQTGQAIDGMILPSLSAWDHGNYFISMTADDIEKHKDVLRVKNAVVMMATYYNVSSIPWETFKGLKKIADRPGLSDHSIGIDNCVRAYEEYGIRYIEKHFTMNNEMSYLGKVFRDTEHGLNPVDFEELAKKVNAYQ